MNENVFSFVRVYVCLKDTDTYFWQIIDGAQGWQCRSASLKFPHRNIYFLNTVMLHERWILWILMTKYSFSNANLKANCPDILHIISQNLMGRLPWHLLRKFMLPTGRTLLILVTPKPPTDTTLFSPCTQDRDSGREKGTGQKMYTVSL